MKTSTMLAALGAAAVWAAPLSLNGTSTDSIMQELKLTRFVEPATPDCLRGEGIGEGSVTLAISRDAAGQPVDILVLLATHPKLAEAALDAARQWRFVPADNAVDRAPVTVHLGFKLQGIVVFPFGKKLEVESAPDTRSGKVHDLIRVPSLQMLRPVPKVLAQPMPAYPAALVARGLEGTADVRFYVDEGGRVRMPEVVEASAPEFAEAAVAAVSQWRYESLQNNGPGTVAREQWSFQFKATN